MAWYKTGTVSVIQGDTVVTAKGTRFASNVRVGDGFTGPDGEWYEVVNIASETVLGIYPAYKGPSLADQTNYMIAPLQGYNKESADRLRAITDGFKDITEDVAAAEAARVGAESARDAAKVSETNAKTSETNSKNSETIVINAKDAAELAATNAQASETNAKTSETNAKASETAADTSKTQAATSATAAAGSAVTATQKATEASASATEAKTSETNAKASELAAKASENAAKTSETNAAADAVSTAADVVAADDARVKAEQARDEAVAAAGTVTGSLMDQGPWDASTGTYPVKPAVSSFWKVTGNGSATDGGVTIEYGIGDTLMFSKPLEEFYKIDNTESVSSVNGQTGVVVLTKSDVDLGNVNNTADSVKPVSGPQQAALDLKADKSQLGTAAAGTLTTSTRDQNIGRVLRVGDGGFTGRSISLPVTDLNTILEPGRFAFSNGVTNGPATGVAYYLDVQTHGSSLVFQRLQEMSYPSADKTYTRVLAGGSWTPWLRSLNAGTFGIGGRAIDLASAAEVNALGQNDQGYYAINNTVSSALGIPKGYGGMIMHYGRGGNNAVQHFVSSGTNDIVMATRTFNDTSIGWSPWAKNFTSLDAPTSTLNGLTGQILRIGDYGYGGYVPQLNESQINAQRMSGHYYIGGQGLGILPTNTNGYLTIETVSATYSKQTFTHYIDGRTWIRTCNDNTWSGWAKINNPVKSMGAEVTDLNNTTNGIQMFNIDFTNIPPTIGYGVVQSMWRGPTECTQYAWGITSNNTAMRRYISGSWTAWQDMTPFGVGQNWGPNLQGSRSYDTTYTNNSGRTMMVQVFAGATSAVNVGLSVVTGGTSIIGQYSTAAGNYVSVGPVAVAPGATYVVSQRNGTAAINTWAEFK